MTSIIEDRAPLYLALVHYPVLNRKGDTIASAITNLDLHDLGRLACTFEIPRCYIVSPLADQQALAERVLSHWIIGVGKELHPDREQALRRLRVVESIASAQHDIGLQWGKEPKIWATSARPREHCLSIHNARQLVSESSEPYLLLLGTGWGLAPLVLEEADAVLETIRGVNGYNHLSVRCAAAILLDRLIANNRQQD